jgi:type I restriction enzyme S subunit
MSNELLPQAWATTTLGEVCSKPQYGWTCKGAKRGRVRYLRTTDISDGQIDWSTVPFCADVPDDIEKYRVHANDILVSRAGSVGVSHLLKDVPYETVFASYLIRFNTKEGIEPKFVEAFLNSKSYWESISEFTAGIAIPNVNASKLASLELPLAPLAEQQRIVTKLDVVLGRLKSCRDRLAKIPALLKAFRRTVLAAACSGRLTADWREKNQVKGEIYDSENSLEGFPILPESWRSVQLETVCANIVDCPHSTPKWTPTGQLCLRTTNFKAGFLDLSEVRYVSNKTFIERIERLRPQPDDVLYSREGGILGIACMIPQGVDLCLGQRMMLFRTKSDFNPKLLMYWLNSPVILRRVRELTGGSAAPHLNVKEIKNFPTPVPPLREQQEIVRRVENLFVLADRLEARFIEGQKRADSIAQSILAKAFRGELVPTEAELAKVEGRSIESAEDLLERIKSSSTTSN